MTGKQCDTFESVHIPMQNKKKGQKEDEFLNFGGKFVTFVGISWMRDGSSTSFFSRGFRCFFFPFFLILSDVTHAFNVLLFEQTNFVSVRFSSETYTAACFALSIS